MAFLFCFLPWFSFAKAHRRGLCLCYHEQKNCPHTVTREHCFHINSLFGGLFVSFSDLGLVFVFKNKVIIKKKLSRNKKGRLTRTNSNWLFKIPMLYQPSEQPRRAHSVQPARDRCIVVLCSKTCLRPARLLFGIHKMSLGFVLLFRRVIVHGLSPLYPGATKASLEVGTIFSLPFSSQIRTLKRRCVSATPIPSLPV